MRSYQNSGDARKHLPGVGRTHAQIVARWGSESVGALQPPPVDFLAESLPET
jgi:nucleotidyltransferase/DNA polymerase involved in DNA repair